MDFLNRIYELSFPSLLHFWRIVKAIRLTHFMRSDSDYTDDRLRQWNRTNSERAQQIGHYC